MTEPSGDVALLERHDAVLLDLDGTVYRGNEPIAGAAEAIEHVRERGTAVRFVTNNASKAPTEVADHLRSVGVAADTEEVSTSSQAAAGILVERLAPGSGVLVVGTGALAAEIDGLGLRAVRKVGAEVADIAAVVQGHSPKTTWVDLAEACVAIRAGALWVACNLDATLPTERGELPGNGAMVAALRAATGAEPVVAGKPRPPLFTTAAESANATSALVVGDRLDTDISGAVAAGLAGLAVLTGVVTPERLLAAGPAERPRYLAADLGALTAKAGDLEIGPRAGWRIDDTGSVLTVSGDSGGKALELLRALCAHAWRTGTTAVKAADDPAAAALSELRLA
ncbi:HAD family hydrolase [Prauserella marina]|uniref:Haloacid Dehalogenase Superfamily Class (Subfamily) IIA n=1 Tax=Prauserella marina TaxID=530584 RepID=A0A222VZZ9_9PSEU|nr:HAD-IIA family hydrolase [Prauserella marina]ASR39528.1 HAD family hydrolase [Prauserella marina]PWV79917.1 HAD superfamily hydrolase (TIGR01450 family) [Prauserella marina]SDD87157.1 Haloacid Dehalogenase Superfamily Class (subfamily) IIA [Prauserella marina]